MAKALHIAHAHGSHRPHRLRHDAFDVFLVLMIGTLLFFFDMYAAALLNR